MALDPTRVMLRTSSVPAVEVSVLWVQQRLNAALAPADAPRVAEDGVWGPQTETALRSYVTGVLGAPLDSTVYSAQLAPGSRTRLGMTKALEAALAGAGSTGSTLLFWGAILGAGWALFRRWRR